MATDVPVVHHFPPDVFNVLVDLLPKLNRSKRDLLRFFQSAGVPRTLYSDIERELQINRDSHGKRDIAHAILLRLNERGDAMLTARREIVKRAVQFDSYETCYDDDRLPARGLVAQLRDLVNAKDTFTRLKDEHDAERRKHREAQASERERTAARRREREAIKRDLYALFAFADPYNRAREFESVLTRLFAHFEILIREAFRVVVNGQTIEQIDGLIELDGRLFLVELKWEKGHLGKADAATHLVRVYARHDANGLLIAANGFAPAVVEDHRDALKSRIALMCDMEEIVRLLESEQDLRQLLRAKVSAAIADKNPYYRVL